MSERTYKLQKGDQVVMHTCMEHDHPDNFGKIWTCRSDEFQHKGHDYGSIFLEGFSGSFSTEFLQKVDVSALVDSLQQQVAELKRQLRRSDREWASATNEVVRLQEQLGERDRKIAQLQETDKLHTSGAKQLVQDLHTLRVDRDKLQEALEQIQYHLHREQYMSAESVVDAALGE
ncbi:hypothetical protein [Paenibacillus ottowii]